MLMGDDTEVNRRNVLRMHRWGSMDVVLYTGGSAVEGVRKWCGGGRGDV